ncbi:hypothetical protein Z517_11603 [Fonsecaea pedrosoi CBS 271.37]|uniref:PRISE-like Rossmann-fold domain-containing protein n=1 Tax=Fonsecaea pedrosoi CBS 271.37 TaxID=1442368 RepID=A0A0D2G212_9EURO|nr:uncharacterized protein Z517_11603 [Fonsecaea pedrosoi CBS 271.37]KIW74833.1 hypothetical protein Z517_11603 [Fonsecaea pedrosoi CBS 271.37]
MGRHALVMGASGITGWAIVNQILRGYPQKGIFSKVTAVTNRPLAQEHTLWPKSDALQVCSGLDLLEGTQGDLEAKMRQKVRDINNVTDLYFYAYKHSSIPEEESSVNTQMLERTIRAVDRLSSNLSFVVLPSGTKAYGVHLGKDLFPFQNQLPLTESLPRIPEPHASRMFYYQQIDSLRRLSRGRSWQWVDLRPDVIPGFVPNSNTYCLAQTLAVYLSLFATVEGKGTTCPFPGSTEAWNTLSNDSPQDAVAQFSIFASLNPDKTAGQSFNVAGSDQAVSWSERWPIICQFFGLEGTEPVESSLAPADYMRSHLATWSELVQTHGLETNLIRDELAEGKAGYQKHIMSELCFDRSLDLGRMRQAGFQEVSDSKRAWWTAFERFREAKAIP